MPICRECGRRKEPNYFLSESLCKKCGAKRRIPRANPLQTIALSVDNPNASAETITATANVVRRLKRQAGLQVPRTARDYVASNAPWLMVAAFWGVGIFGGFPSLNAIRPTGTPVVVQTLYLIFWMFWYTGIPVLLGMWIESILGKPRSLAVATATFDLAVERAKAIGEAQAFYSSAEWAVLRAVVIAQSERHCVECRKFMLRKSDLTVDHVLPRSKFPHLALERENLRVLCRSCNSRKGNRVYADS